MPRHYVVSRFASVSWVDGDLEITSPVARTTFRTIDASLLNVLAAFAVPRRIEDVVRGATEARDVAALINEWIAASILVDADSPELAALQAWDRAALAAYVVGPTMLPDCPCVAQKRQISSCIGPILDTNPAHVEDCYPREDIVARKNLMSGLYLLVMLSLGVLIGLVVVREQLPERKRRTAKATAR
jgi:hypothetical protein